MRRVIPHFWHYHGDRVRSFLPYIIYLVYLILGALAFYFLEKYTAPYEWHRADWPEKCISGYDFWAAIFYVVSASSTIGFGTIHACTIATRILSVFYSIVGIPLVLLILADIGKRICHLIRNVYIPFYRRIHNKCYTYHRNRKRQKAKILYDATDIIYIDADSPPPVWKQTHGDLAQLANSFESDYVADSPYVATQSGSRNRTKANEQSVCNDSNKHTKKSTQPHGGIVSGIASDMIDDDLPDIPISFGVGLTLACVLLLATFYYYADEYSALESVYYSFLAFVAGDFHTTQFKYTIPIYMLIFLGFSMLSTTVHIIQNNINNLISRVKREVTREIQRQLVYAQEVAVLDGEDVQKVAEGILHDVLGKYNAPWLTSIMPQTQLDQLETFCEEVINHVNVGCQTDQKQRNSVEIATLDDKQCGSSVQMTDSAALAVATCSDEQAQTEPLPFQPTDAQTSPHLKHTHLSHTTPDLQSMEQPQMISKATSSHGEGPHMRDSGVTARPRTRTIWMQFPRRSLYLGPDGQEPVPSWRLAQKKRHEKCSDSEATTSSHQHHSTTVLQRMKHHRKGL